MLLGRSLTCIIITLSLISCGAGKQLNAPVWYTSLIAVDTAKLHFDGYYTNISRTDYPQDKYPAVNPVFFTSENKIYVSHGSYPDSTLFTCKFYKEKVAATDLGKYIIEGNKIVAFVPVAVAMGGGAYYATYNLNFSGTIVNRNLITSWKAIPPFPEKIEKSIGEGLLNPGIFEAHDMKFIQADSIKCLQP
jgi:hypothetical protein